MFRTYRVNQKYLKNTIQNLNKNTNKFFNSTNKIQNTLKPNNYCDKNFLFTEFNKITTARKYHEDFHVVATFLLKKRPEFLTENSFKILSNHAEHLKKIRSVIEVKYDFPFIFGSERNFIRALEHGNYFEQIYPLHALLVRRGIDDEKLLDKIYRHGFDAKAIYDFLTLKGIQSHFSEELINQALDNCGYLEKINEILSFIYPNNQKEVFEYLLKNKSSILEIAEQIKSIKLLEERVTLTLASVILDLIIKSKTKNTDENSITISSGAKMGLTAFKKVPDLKSETNRETKNTKTFSC